MLETLPLSQASKTASSVSFTFGATTKQTVSLFSKPGGVYCTSSQAEHSGHNLTVSGRWEELSHQLNCVVYCSAFHMHTQSNSQVSTVWAVDWNDESGKLCTHLLKAGDSYYKRFN